MDLLPPPGRLPAQSSNLIVRRMGDETVVYDRTEARAHCLNRVAAMVFAGCGELTSPGALSRRLEEDLGIDGTEARGLLRAGLYRLHEAGLLEDPPEEEGRPPVPLRSRRRALRAVGLAGLAPLVLSITAPRPAEALTCVPRDGVCNSSQQCCPDAPCCRPKVNQPPSCSPGTGGCLP